MPLANTLTFTVTVLFGILYPAAFASTSTNDTNIARNDYPILFIHGLMGQGASDSLYRYWGNKEEGWYIPTIIEETFKQRVITVFVGPVSSDWDRACEVYAQLKGTVVDYGAHHSKEFKHARYGRNYTGQGLYPEWGNSAKDKIHIITHSQGANTARLLVHLLLNGDREEMNEYVNSSGGEISPLFNTESPMRRLYPWIASIVALTAPLKGTTAATVLKELPFFTIMLRAFLIIKNAQSAENHKKELMELMPQLADASSNAQWDSMLEHFNLSRNPGESILAYAARVLSSDSAFITSTDNAFYDLGVEAAKHRLYNLDVDPGVFYFSVGAKATIRRFLPPCFGRKPPCNHALNDAAPNPKMNIELIPVAIAMATYNNDTLLGDSKAFHASDGAVNTVSMDAPWKIQRSIVNWASSRLNLLHPGWYHDKESGKKKWWCPWCSTSQWEVLPSIASGTWYYLAELKDFDHLDFLNNKNIIPLYQNLVSLLVNLNV